MSPDIKNALRIKRLVSDFMKEQVYRGDYESPRLKPDATGAFHYSDRLLRIACAPSPREGWGNCIVRIEIIRRRLLFRKFEQVLSTGYGIDVAVFRPGMWIAYIEHLTAGAAGLEEQREVERRRHQLEDQARLMDENFGPVDDAAMFEKW
jgi:hypothetical protein